MNTTDKSKILREFTLFLYSFLISFVNYCLFQILDIIYIPLTIMPIICYILKYPIPYLVIFALGIIDDTFLNSPLGLHPVIYLIFAHTTMNSKVHTNKAKIIIAISLYILTNIVYFIVLSN
ncbi:MAG: hypothetical protein LBE97_01335 [Holosporales bacterium]|jgi:hypothetical protein|nr:hypothetical protein [Holosporales bacterium]